MQKKKNGFLLFIFSFLPGAGEMYMGFMKMGISLLGAFLTAVFIVSVTGFPELSVLPALIYIYSFFHAHNIAGLDDQKFSELEDEYLFGLDKLSDYGDAIKTKYRKLVAIVLMILGFVMVWRTTTNVLWDYLGGKHIVVKIMSKIGDYGAQMLIGIAIIGAGCYLIAGRKDKEQ